MMGFPYSGVSGWGFYNPFALLGYLFDLVIFADALLLGIWLLRQLQKDLKASGK